VTLPTHTSEITRVMETPGPAKLWNVQTARGAEVTALGKGDSSRAYFNVQLIAISAVVKSKCAVENVQLLHCQLTDY